jgi:hypothetical protein
MPPIIHALVQHGNIRDTSSGALDKLHVPSCFIEDSIQVRQIGPIL